MSKERTKEQLLEQIETLKSDLNLSLLWTDVYKDRIDRLMQEKEELENRADEAYKETRHILDIMEEATSSAHYNFSNTLETTGEFRISDALYYIVMVHRQMEHEYDPKRNESEE